MEAPSDAYILIVEDEADIAELLRFHIEREGFEAKTVHSGRIAMDVIARQPPRLLVLDLMLPDLDGLEVCRRLKWNSLTRHIPVLIVSAKGEEADVVAGIELGADDYVTKPFSPKELIARLKNILRRQSEWSKEPTGDRLSQLTFADGAVAIDRDRHAVTLDGSRIELTLTEFGILYFLASKPGFVRTREQIIKSVHGENMVLSSRTIDVHITSLRRKLGRLGRAIETVRGVGYRLSEPAQTSPTGSRT